MAHCSPSHPFNTSNIQGPPPYDSNRHHCCLEHRSSVPRSAYQVPPHENNLSLTAATFGIDNLHGKKDLPFYYRSRTHRLTRLPDILNFTYTYICSTRKGWRYAGDIKITAAPLECRPGVVQGSLFQYSLQKMPRKTPKCVDIHQSAIG